MVTVVVEMEKARAEIVVATSLLVQWGIVLLVKKDLINDKTGTMEMTNTHEVGGDALPLLLRRKNDYTKSSMDNISWFISDCAFLVRGTPTSVHESHM